MDVAQRRFDAVRHAMDDVQGGVDAGLPQPSGVLDDLVVEELDVGGVQPRTPSPDGRCGPVPIRRGLW